MIYILDSNILLHIIRNNQVIDAELKKVGIYNTANAFISIVSVGELLSISKQNNWGYSKQQLFEGLIKTFQPIPIQSRVLLEVYAEIDAFSRSKLSSQPLPKGQTARTMGKNDLWIAATTHLSNASLITTDNDFDHLNNIYFPIIKLSSIPI